MSRRVGRRAVAEARRQPGAGVLVLVQPATVRDARGERCSCLIAKALTRAGGRLSIVRLGTVVVSAGGLRFAPGAAVTPGGSSRRHRPCRAAVRAGARGCARTTGPMSTATCQAGWR